MQALFQVCGVCTSWRQIGKRVFFAQPWKSATLLCHPLQLFTTVGVWSSLLRCTPLHRNNMPFDNALATHSVLLA